MSDTPHVPSAGPVRADLAGTGLGVRASPTQSGPSNVDVWIWGYKAPGE